MTDTPRPHLSGSAVGRLSRSAARVSRSAVSRATRRAAGTTTARAAGRFFRRQLWDNVFWNLCSAVPIWTAYECLTLWLSNLLHAGRNWSEEAALLTAALGRQRSPVVLVTNEVGLGIVPDNALARSFRDAAGLLNQNVAAVADEVEFVVAGLPMKVK